MRWSLSEFLNLVELRSQSWCFVTLGSKGGFSNPHNEAIYFYAVLEGSAKISGVTGGPIKLGAGDAIFVLSGEAHAIRSKSDGAAEVIPFLTTRDYADAPPHFSVGAGYSTARILAGRLNVRWPGGQLSRALPAVLKVRPEHGFVNLPLLLEKASGTGSMALLTRAANLLFVGAFHDHPECRRAFHEFGLHDPVSRAQYYLERHCFDPWTVEMLARKVGMGRSNFAARFTQEVGVPPMVYLADQRMKQAALLLEETDMKITDICERVGYHSETAFIRRFTANYGMTPGEMRKHIRDSQRASSSRL